MDSKRSGDYDLAMAFSQNLEDAADYFARRVFVKEAFVMGKAKTVCEVDQ